MLTLQSLGSTAFSASAQVHVLTVGGGHGDNMGADGWTPVTKVPDGYVCPAVVNKYNWDKKAAGVHAEASDEFFVRQIDNTIQVKRKGKAVMWGLNLVFPCHKGGDQDKKCQTLVVGGSYDAGITTYDAKNKAWSKAFTVSAGYTCPAFISKKNWHKEAAGMHKDYDDKFHVRQSGTTVHVRRDGAHKNWGMVLAFDCCIPDKTVLQGANLNAKTKVGSLDACIGECDHDKDCKPGLMCFQREHGETIPGCKGLGGGKNWDYCYSPAPKAKNVLQGANLNAETKAGSLEACIGECDHDKDCKAGLKCFQRQNGEKIPGCVGKGSGKDWDYCYDPNPKPVCDHTQCADWDCNQWCECYDQAQETVYEQNNCADDDQPCMCSDVNLKQLQGANLNAKTKVGSLDACIGECDHDKDCKPGLMCFQREHGETIPGCKGLGGGKNWDYCYSPAPKAKNVLQGANLNAETKAGSLEACIGECDHDKDCKAGLKCFQRQNGETIPGCVGKGSGKDWDYCYDPGQGKP